MESSKIRKGENPITYYRNLVNKKVKICGINSGNEISLKVFAILALMIITCPATEAMVERAFSALKSISTDFNQSMKEDLFNALATIKLCLRYKRNSNFNET